MMSKFLTKKKKNSNLYDQFFRLYLRKCLKYHANDHKHSCSFRSSDNYDYVGLPFVISLPESKLTCKNVFEQIKIYAK